MRPPRRPALVLSTGLVLVLVSAAGALILAPQALRTPGAGLLPLAVVALVAGGDDPDRDTQLVSGRGTPPGTATFSHLVINAALGVVGAGLAAAVLLLVRSGRRAARAGL